MRKSGRSLESIISAYGAAARNKLSAPSIRGEPEDQLRNPLETLFNDLADHCGLTSDKLTLVGESLLSDLKTRPDFAVTYHGALIGYIEVKAPGKGADPRRFRDKHDKDQWKKLSALPNLLYTDGNTSLCGATATSSGRSSASTGTWRLPAHSSDLAQGSAGSSKTFSAGSRCRQRTPGNSP